jgi:flagellar biosynthesis/type III secretory pathway ATPase
MTEPAPNALERLERALARGERAFPRVSVSGTVSEITTSHYRVSGLSRFVKMGECVRIDVGDRSQIGEVVRIDDAAVTLKPFDSRCDGAMGARAYRAESLSLWPREDWKGRVIDARWDARSTTRASFAQATCRFPSTPSRRRRCGARGCERRSRPAFA